MAKHECTQTETIASLKINQAVFMEKLDTLIENQNETNQKLDKFIDTADVKYATKERVDKLESLMNKVSWGFITGAISIIIGLIVYIWNIAFNK